MLEHQMLTGWQLSLQDGVLSETATRVLASTSSFKRSDSRSGAALQRIGSFPVASRGSSLAGALQTTALVAPCSPRGVSSASGSRRVPQSTHSTFSRTFSRLAFGDSAASGGALAEGAGPGGEVGAARSIRCVLCQKNDVCCGQQSCHSLSPSSPSWCDVTQRSSCVVPNVLPSVSLSCIYFLSWSFTRSGS